MSWWCGRIRMQCSSPKSSAAAGGQIDGGNLSARAALHGQCMANRSQRTGRPGEGGDEEAEAEATAEEKEEDEEAEAEATAEEEEEEEEEVEVVEKEEVEVEKVEGLGRDLCVAL